MWLPLTFKIVEKSQYAYILWPWSEPAQFLYAALAYGAKYKIEKPSISDRLAWMQFRPIEGCRGEYNQGLNYGFTDWGARVYRRFHARGTHYLTQHGLDGLPSELWEEAYEYAPGQSSKGVPLIMFRVESIKVGVFELSFYEWMQYFVSGQNGGLSTLAITVTERKE